MSRPYSSRRSNILPQRHRSAASFSHLGLPCDFSMLAEDRTVILQTGGNDWVNHRSLVVDEVWIIDSRGQDASNSKGLSQETVVKQMRSRIQEASAADEEAICVVCQDQLGRKYGRIARLDCGHCYHPRCIQTWLTRNNTCPLCKATALPAS